MTESKLLHLKNTIVINVSNFERSPPRKRAPAIVIPTNGDYCGLRRVMSATTLLTRPHFVSVDS